MSENEDQSNRKRIHNNDREKDTHERTSSGTDRTKENQIKVIRQGLLHGHHNKEFLKWTKKIMNLRANNTHEGIFGAIISANNS